MTLGSHQQTIGKSQVHITPRWIIDALGPFDLDPCAADPRPWGCASDNYALPQNGLILAWYGFVFLNPPFDRYAVADWIDKLAHHRAGGIALLHAHTETEWFRPCWEHASAILFMAHRISFYLPDGTEQPANSGAPPVLVAFGAEAKRRLAACNISGALVTGWTLKSGQLSSGTFPTP